MCTAVGNKGRAIVDREIAENCLHSTNHHKVFKEKPHPTNLLGVFFWLIHPNHQSNPLQSATL